MESEQRIQALEQEVQILKSQIQAILLDIQAHLLTNAYPALRGHNTAGNASAEDDEDEDEYDRAAPAPAPKVRKVSSASASARSPKAMPPPASPTEPILASLDEQQDWVLQNIQSLGINRTRELIASNTDKHRFSPEVSDTLLRFTDMYAAAADEPTIPSRPAAMPAAPVKVSAVNRPPQRPAKNHIPQPTLPPTMPSVPPPAPTRNAPAEIPGLYKAAPRPKPAPAAPPMPAHAQQADPVKQVYMPDENDKSPKPNDAPNVVLRLIAGVQNAGAGVRWGKTKS